MKPFELNRHIVEIVRALKGPENAAFSSNDDLRWGTHGSLSVQPFPGNWYDHENSIGGGPLQFLQREGMTNGEAVKWLKSTLGIDLEFDRVIIDTYDYFDIKDGRHFQKVRYEPKWFAWRRMGEDGK